MALINAYIENNLGFEDVGIDELISAVREDIDALIEQKGTPDLINILLSDGLCYYDEEDRTWYARVRMAVLNTLYEWSLRGFVSLSPTHVRWVR